MVDCDVTLHAIIGSVRAHAARTQGSDGVYGAFDRRTWDWLRACPIRCVFDIASIYTELRLVTVHGSISYVLNGCVTVCRGWENGAAFASADTLSR